MRTVILALSAMLSLWHEARAGELQSAAVSSLSLSETQPSIGVSYTVESLTNMLDVRFGRTTIILGISNAFELPEHEPPGGLLLDPDIVLSQALDQIEVDIGNERFFSLTFSFSW